MQNFNSFGERLLVRVPHPLYAFSGKDIRDVSILLPCQLRRSQETTASTGGAFCKEQDFKALIHTVLYLSMFVEGNDVSLPLSLTASIAIGEDESVHPSVVVSWNKDNPN